MYGTVKYFTIFSKLTIAHTL